MTSQDIPRLGHSYVADYVSGNQMLHMFVNCCGFIIGLFFFIRPISIVINQSFLHRFCCQIHSWQLPIINYSLENLTYKHVVLFWDGVTKKSTLLTPSHANDDNSSTYLLGTLRRFESAAFRQNIHPSGCTTGCRQRAAPGAGELAGPTPSWRRVGGR